jgi:hypothetical protein
LDVVGNCEGLYISNGENYSTVPSEQQQRATWMTVELGQGFQQTFRLVAKSPELDTIPLISAGQYTLTLSTTPRGATAGHGNVTLRGGGQTPVPSLPFELKSGSNHTLIVTANAAKHQLNVAVDGVGILSATLSNSEGPIRVDTVQPQSQHGQGVLVSTMPSPRPTLCQSLTH